MHLFTVEKDTCPSAADILFLNHFLCKDILLESHTVNSRYLEVVGTFLQVQITRSANLFALRVIWTC